MEYIYTIDPSVNEPVLLINKHVGKDGGIIGADFERELRTLDNMGKKCIHVYLNSPGGMVYDGYSIFTAILTAKTPVYTYASGIVASIAAVIFQAGHKRFMYDYASLMIHNPFVESEDEDSEEKNELSLIRKSLMTMIASRTGTLVNRLSAMMNAETWLSPDKALALNFCDEIITTKEIIAVEEMADILNEDKRFVVSSWEKYDKYLNKIIEKNKTNNMNTVEIAKIFNLAPDSSEETITNFMKSLAALQNKAEEEMKNEDSDEDIKDEDIKNEDSDEDIKAEDKNEDKCNFEQMYNELKAKQDKAEAENKAIMVDELINSAVKNGKIKNDLETIKVWKSIAIDNYENASLLIKNLTINKKAPTAIEIVVDEKKTNEFLVKNEIDARMKGYFENPSVAYSINSELMKEINKR